MNGDGYSRDGGGRAGGSRQYNDHRDRDRDRDRADRDRDDRGGDRDRRRRRSRSPRQTSRRDRDYEVDTYSSSRDYRERERETNYARRDHRRDDRNWGDSYSRRDRPRHDRDRDRERERDDVRGPPRRGDRDRDYDDRGRSSRRDGGFGGGGGGGGGGGARERKKSASPPVKKREPTPDLDGYVSIQVRPRRMTQWDIKPAGYDNITAEQAKLSGMFPLPGAPRAAPMDPTKLAAFVNPATGTANSAGLQPLNAKQAKRLFVYNLPSNVTSSELVDFFNLQLNGLNVVSGNNPCLSASLSHDKQYASVEFKAPEDATVALAMDGISMQSHDSLPDAEGLSIRRPRDYITPATDDNPPPPDHLSSTVNDSPYKLSISQIPVYVEEAQVQELVETFGKLRSFVLVKDTGSAHHRGIAFCEYVDRSQIDDVIAGLNTITLGDSHLKVARATVGVTQQIGIDGGVNAISVLASTSAAEDHDRSRVVCLLNMVTADELLNDQEYEDIQEEVREECEKHGHILDMKIPRPAGVRTTAGVGKIYIKYETPDMAQKAIQALAGRQFSRRTVVATEFSEESFDVDAW